MQVLVADVVGEASAMVVGVWAKTSISLPTRLSPKLMDTRVLGLLRVGPCSKFLREAREPQDHIFRVKVLNKIAPRP